MHNLITRLVTAGMIATGLPFVLAATGASASVGGPHTAPAPTASESSCLNSPSNSNCNGVWISENGPCWESSYIPQGGEYFYNQNGYSFETDLRYSTDCKSNFSVTTVIGTGLLPYEFSGKVRRAAGPDGPYLMEHGGWYTAEPWSDGATVISPLVYSPDNAAQACFSNRSNDQVGCTPWI